MARYFQHLNSNSDLFQSVTTLDYIDNSDPTFILYYFKDGTKCNKSYIGKINDFNAYDKMEMAEISSPANKWELELYTPKEERRVAQNANGEMVEVADLYMCDRKAPARPSLRVIKQPAKTQITVEPDSKYYIGNAPSKSAATPVVSPDTEVPTKSYDFNQVQSVANTLNTASGNYNLPNLSTYKTIEFIYNGVKHIMNTDEFLRNAVSKPTEKIVEKVVEKVVERKVDEPVEHIKIDLDDTQRSLIDNMINMSTKEKCDIEMVLTMSLPPVSVYQLIKSVYPAGMSREFVNIIADGMKVKELKTAVAAGLLAYYDEDGTVEVEAEPEVKTDDVKQLDDNHVELPPIEIVEEDGLPEFSVPVVLDAIEDTTSKKKAGRPKKKA